MQIFLFINGHDQHGILGIQQLFGEFQTLLHHGQPLAVAVLVVIVHIVVVVFPVPRTGVVGRVDIDAVHPCPHTGIPEAAGHGSCPLR